jgi:phospholipid/cholesterol/gamma-HCH transport system substrate-binding protein
MPARKQVSWAELRVGVFVLATVAILATFVFYVTGGGRVFTRQVHYTTYLPDVSGLSAGAPVRLVGVEVGTVIDVGLSEFPDDRFRAAVVRFRVSQNHQKNIRQNSEAFITTEGLLGESVLELTRGTEGDPIPAGGMVRGVQRGNIKQVVQNVDQITGDVRGLIADVRAGKGTLGKLIEDPALYNRAYQAVDDFQALTARASSGEGTLGKLVVSTELYDQLKGTANTVDEVARDLRAGKGTLGKLIYDTTIHDKADSIVTRADRIVARVDAGEGTLGKLVHDETLYNRAQETFGNASEITGKVNRGEGTFGRAVNDPRLYDNINEFTSEMRALISDFRKDPKKYLRVKFSLF